MLDALTLAVMASPLESMLANVPEITQYDDLGVRMEIVFPTIDVFIIK